MSEAVDRLLAQWEYLRHVPSQALEAARSAASVPLSDVAATAVVALADMISEAMRAGDRVPDETITDYVILTNILDGSFEMRRNAGGRSTRPVDNFQYRLVRQEMPEGKQPREPLGYLVFRGGGWDRANSWREGCVAADQPFVAIRLAGRRAQVAFDMRTMRTPLSRGSLLQIRAAFERSGHAIWSEADLSLCSVRSSKAAHRLARSVKPSNKEACPVSATTSRTGKAGAAHEQTSGRKERPIGERATWGLTRRRVTPTVTNQVPTRPGPAVERRV
jgi:hypothetical protein